MRRTAKRWLAMLLCMVLLLSNMSFPAYAEAVDGEPAGQIAPVPAEETGEEATAEPAGRIAPVEEPARPEADGEGQKPTPVTADMGTNWTAGTYEVTGDVRIENRIAIAGKVTLNLTSGKFTAAHGIYVPDGSELEIFGSGELFAEGYQGNAAIGGNPDAKAGTIYIGGGTITANGGSNAAGIGGGSGENSGYAAITIAGEANVTATGWDEGAGIGAGYDNKNAGSVNIISGTVTANGGEEGGAGIGGGGDEITSSRPFAGIIVIYGGTVTATGGRDGGAGIGSGENSDFQGLVEIRGGDVTANGAAGGAGIGAGDAGNATDAHIEIRNGLVKANGGADAAGIGGGDEYDGVGGEGCDDVQLLGGTVIAKAGGGSACAIGNGGSDGHKGSIAFADNMKVYAGNDGENYEREGMPFGKTERVAACQYRHNARIDVCDHPGQTYSSTGRTGHKQTCDYCAASDFKEEAHTFAEHGTTCTVCGYQLEHVLVTFRIHETVTTVEVAPYSTDNKLPSTGEIPAPEGKIFIGWDVNGETKQPGDFFAVGNQDLVITALYADKVTLTFDGNKGNILLENDPEPHSAYTVELAKGADYTIPELTLSWPGDETRTFQGWKLGEDRELRQDGYRFTVSEDMTLKAIWGIYTVRFDSRGGSAVESQTVFYEESVVRPADPTREGYSFRAWQQDGKDYDFTSPVTGNMTLTALWAGKLSLPQGVTAAVNGEEVSDAVAGETVTLTVALLEHQAVDAISVKCGEETVEVTRVNDTTFTFAMPEGPVTVTVTTDRSPWYTLQRELQGSGEIKLDRDYVDGLNEGPLVVYENTTVTLDLAGHTISRGLTAAQENGYVLLVSGNLTVIDSVGGGKITGGWNSDNGGGVIVCREEGTLQSTEATLTLLGGSITGNKTGKDGGGVYVLADDGAGKVAFILKGGSVSGNRAENIGGGVYVQGNETSRNAAFILESGSVTGNTAPEECGGVYLRGGVLTMTGGSVTGNACNPESFFDGRGETGGLCAINSSLTVSGGSITDNCASFKYGGLYVNQCDFRLSGSPIIKDNKTSHPTTGAEAASNLYLFDGQLITVAGPLSNAEPIGVSAYKLGAFTQGLSGKGTAESFTSDITAYLVGTDPEGEAVLGEVRTVSFDSNGGSEVPAQNVASGAVARKPADPVKDGFLFAGWQLNGEDYDFASPVTEDITLKAVWGSAWAGLQQQIDSAGATAVIELPGNVTALESDAVLTVPEGKSITLDLKGFTLSRGLTEAKDNGGVILVKGSLTLEDSSAEKTGRITGGWTKRDGGGILLKQEDGGAAPSLTLNGGSITGNKAEGSGGGVFAWEGSCTMNGGSISGNRAKEDGGGVLFEDYTQFFTVNGGEIFDNTAEGSFSYGGGVAMHGGDFTMSGGVIRNNSSAHRGGGVALEDDALVCTIKDGAVIRDNTASYGGGVCLCGGTFEMYGGEISGNAAIDGGGIEVQIERGSLAFYGGSVTGNTASRRGGGVYYDLNATLIMKKCEITDNTASEDGGGLYMADGTLDMTRSKISGNSAGNAGGGLYLEYADAYVHTDCLISNNSADDCGGGVYLEKGSFSMKDTGILENTAKGRGGGVYSDGSFEMLDFGSSISNNESESLGGAVYVRGGTFTMKEGELRGNTAANDGGGAAIEEGIFTLEGGRICRNGSKDNGGGVAVLYCGSFVMTGGEVTGNRAADCGGGIWICNSTTRAELSGAIEITDNTAADRDDNINMDRNWGGVITIAGPLNNSKPIGVSMDTPGIFTQGLPGNGTAASFTSNQEGYTVQLNDAGEAQLFSLWPALQQRINNAANGDTIPLDQDVTAAAEDTALVIPAEKNITLDLAGHTLSRGLTEAKENGNVITVSGSLAVIDSVGGSTITGGFNSQSGGGVRIEPGGAFTLSGGSITGNTAKESGGGLYASGTNEETRDVSFTMTGGTISGNEALDAGGGVCFLYGTLTMSGGSITGNTCVNGPVHGWTGGMEVSYSTFILTGGSITGNTANKYGGLFVGHCDFRLSSGPVITGNTVNGEGRNLYLFDGQIITITGPLTYPDPIGVDVYREGVFTQGLPGKGTAENFTSDSAYLILGTNAQGEALLNVALTVSFDSDGGSEVAAQTVASGALVRKPADPSRDGLVFKGWQLDGADFDFETTPVTQDITLKAVWAAPEAGDINLDGELDAQDLMVLRKHLAGLPIEGRFSEAGADLHPDGVIDLLDLVRLRKILAAGA